MARDWVTIPCLLCLRDEFNAVAPKRYKGSDGTKGDANHTSASDHTPDEESDVLRDHDADDKNEVHALDIDCTGPWPDGKGGEEGGWFDLTILAIVERERQEYLSTDKVGRLQYVIWRGRIASRSWGWTWRTYTSSKGDLHFGHVHFSARYLTNTENDTRPWGVEEGDMPSIAEVEEAAKDGAIGALTFVLSEAYRASQGKAPAATPEDRRARNWKDYFQGIVGGPINEDSIVSAVIAKIPAGSTNLTAEQLAEVVRSGVNDVLKSGVK